MSIFVSATANHIPHGDGRRRVADREQFEISRVFRESLDRAFATDEIIAALNKSPALTPEQLRDHAVQHADEIMQSANEEYSDYRRAEGGGQMKRHEAMDAQAPDCPMLS